MTAVLLLTLGQFAAAALTIAVFLLIARQIGTVFYQDGAMVILVFVMSSFAVIGAVWCVFVRPWWVYLIASSLLAGLLFTLMFWLIDALVAGTQAKMGPAGTVFLLPMLAFLLTYPLGGIAQWLIGLVKR